MRNRLSKLYLINAALLIAHEIDSAFWHEWDLFGLPGGVQGFVLLNLFLVILVLLGFRQAMLGTRWGSVFSLALAGAGLFAFAVHGLFLLKGHPEFRLPVSLSILVLTFVVSILQAGLAIRSLKRKE